MEREPSKDTDPTKADLLLRREEVSKMRFYYQEFHHKCMTWYVTSMGFFLAGMIAASNAPQSDALLGGVAVLCTVALGVTFYWVIAHYGGRIAGLNAYLAPNCDSIPADWETQNKKARGTISGIGSKFFLVILICLQLAMFLITAARYAPHLRALIC